VELIHTLRGPGGRRRVCCRPVDWVLVPAIMACGLRTYCRRQMYG